MYQQVSDAHTHVHTLSETLSLSPLSLFLPPSGLLRWSVICSFLSASFEGVSGNMKGDGTLLGSSLVVGPGDQGILFQYRSREFGDRANVKDILKAVENIRSN